MNGPTGQTAAAALGSRTDLFPHFLILPLPTQSATSLLGGGVVGVRNNHARQTCSPPLPIDLPDVQHSGTLSGRESGITRIDRVVHEIVDRVGT